MGKYQKAPSCHAVLRSEAASLISLACPILVLYSSFAICATVVVVNTYNITHPSHTLRPRASQRPAETRRSRQAIRQPSCDRDTGQAIQPSFEHPPCDPVHRHSLSHTLDRATRIAATSLPSPTTTHKSSLTHPLPPRPLPGGHTTRQNSSLTPQNALIAPRRQRQ